MRSFNFLFLLCQPMSSIFIQSERPFGWKTSEKSKEKYVDSSIVNRFIFRFVFLKKKPHKSIFISTNIYFINNFVSNVSIEYIYPIFLESVFLFHIFNFSNEFELMFFFMNWRQNDLSRKFSILIHNDLNWCILAFIVESV